MSTGDLNGNVEALRSALSQLKCPHSLNPVRAAAGDPAELLPLLSFVLLRFSKHVALLASSRGYQLHGTTDQRFVEAAWRFMRDDLGVHPLALTPAQFLSQGFAERKLLLLRQVIKTCKDHHNAAARKERLAALKGVAHSEQRLYSRSPPHSRRPPPAKVFSELPPLPPAAGSEGSGLVEDPACSPAAAACEAAATGDVPLAASSQQPESAAAGGPKEVATNGAYQHSTTLLPLLKQPQLLRPPCSPGLEQPRPLPGLLLATQATRIPPQQGWQDTGQGVAERPPAQLPAQWARLSPALGPTEGAAAAASTNPVYSTGNGAVMPTLPGALEPGHGLRLANVSAAPAPLGGLQLAAPPPSEPLGQHAEGGGWGGQLAALPAQAAAPAPALQSSAADPATHQLIAHLQLRLQLAEEAVLVTRREAERVQDSLQGRLAVLEGRVKFLEAGFCMQPLGQPALQLPWGSPPKTPADAQRQQQMGTASHGAFGVHWPGQQQQQPEEQPWPPACHGGHQGAAAGSWGAGGRALTAWPAGPVSLQAAPGQRSPYSSAGGAASTTCSAGALTAQAPAASAVAPTCVEPAQRGFSSTTELVSSMHARFSEADEFLKSLQRC